MDTPLKITIISFTTLVVGFFMGIGIGSDIQRTRTIKQSTEVQVVSQELTDWEVLELAIMKTESDFNTYARGSKGDLGLFQITEIYVEEVNRLLGEPTYVHTDAFIPERALEMFTVYQDNHNPKHDYIRAINAHNPGGESIGYSQKVLANMDWVRNYEKIKKQVQEFNRSDSL